MSRFRYSLIAGALVALAACDEAAAPKGASGDLVVRAYIDRDASGSFTAADSSLAGVQVTVTPAGTGATGEPVTATTATDGQATFAALRPGRYTIALAGGAPTGAVLVTNPTPTVGISFQGTMSGAAEFRFSFFPVVVSNRIYRDDNGNGQYDQGIDTPGAGLYAVLKRDSAGAPGATVDSVVADAAGLFTFSRVAPGSYYLVLEQLPTFSYGAAGAVRAIVVGTEPPTLVPGVFTGSLVVPISSARARPVNASVEVEGFVTVPPNVFTSGTGGVNSEIWIQDATGGIAVFSVLSNRTDLPIGTRVRVRGTRTDFSGQEQIAGTLAVTVLANPQVQVAQVITGAQAAARTGFEGELVTVAGFTVDSAPASTATGGYTIRGVTPDGTTLRIRGHSAALLPRSTFVVGNRYTITGILTENGGVSQIKPRGPSDVQGPTAIGTVRTSPLNGVYTVAGTITVAPGSIVSGTNGVNSEIWLQDATGGISVFSVPTANTAGLALGDRVEVTGTLGAFANQLQLQTNPTVTKLGSGTPVAPRVVTGTELAARTYEGQLVTLPAFTVTAPPGTPNAVGAFTVTGTAASGETIQLRVGGSGTGLTPALFTQGSTYSITGVASINNAAIQIKPRIRADVTP